MPEIFCAIEAHARRVLDARKNAYITAWHAAAWVWAKRLPDLREVLSDIEPRTQQQSQGSVDALVARRKLQAELMQAKIHNQKRRKR
jgi:hypothetical protein